MQTLGSTASVIAAIREDATAEAERIEQTTASEVAAIRVIPSREDGEESLSDRDQRLATERRIVAEKIAQQEWEGRRALIEQREAWIARVVAAANERWNQGDDRLARLTALAREAIDRVGRDNCQLTVAAADVELLGAPAAGRRLSGRRDDGATLGVSVVAGPIAAGCIATSGDVAFDNSVEARARRLEPEWRNALAALYRLES